VTTTFPRFVVVAAGSTAAVDVIARYEGTDGSVSVVSSCDVYEFRDGLVAAITSYTVELDAAPDRG
jgi:ketosteroid isomerase-like protein